MIEHGWIPVATTIGWINSWSLVTLSSNWEESAWHYSHTIENINRANKLAHNFISATYYTQYISATFTLFNILYAVRLQILFLKQPSSRQRSDGLMRYRTLTCLHYSVFYVPPIERSNNIALLVQLPIDHWTDFDFIAPRRPRRGAEDNHLDA